MAPASSSSSSQQPTTQRPPTYRQNRRAQQALRNGPKRGPTIGKKYASEKEKNPEKKHEIQVTEELQRAVGDKVDMFICDCSKWVKEYCPLNVKNWSKIGEATRKRLYDKIKGAYTLPSTICGKTINRALSMQCSTLHRWRRYRLKERYFVGYTKDQARRNRPTDVEVVQWEWLVNHWSNETQERISAQNRENRLKQTIKPANGARSTARILHDLMNAPCVAVTQSSIEDPQGLNEPFPTEDEEDPIYVRLYEKTKRHKDGTFDPDAEVNYNALKKLHENEVEKNGVDNLTVQEAFVDVLKTGPNYIRGLGMGPRPPQKDKDGSSERVVQLTTRIEELQQNQQASAEREATLQGVINDLKDSNDALRAKMECMEKDALEREKERDKKMREEFLAMLKGHGMSC